MYKLDLHTHSVASPDGGLSLEDYRRMLAQGRLDYIAITDHNTLEFARTAQSELGAAIIIGEEVAALEGEIVGLFLHELVPSGLSAARTAELIHRQGGLVYIPHPFEIVRRGLPAATLDHLRPVDIIEVYNGRALLHNKTKPAKQWAIEHQIVPSAGSDAHGLHGWGKTMTLIDQPPTVDNLVSLLRTATLVETATGAVAALYPKLNRLRKRADRR